MALILNVANLSKGVAWRFTITKLPLFPTVAGISEAGETVNELPSARHTSAQSAWLKA